MIVEGYVALSALQILQESYLIIAVTSLHGAYNAWKHPGDAVLLQKSIPFTELLEDIEESPVVESLTQGGGR